MTPIYQTKTWPYGTEKTVRVIDMIETADPLNPKVVICGEPSTKEGFIMMRVKHDVAVKNQYVVKIRFEQGGPMGGYWKIIAIVFDSFLNKWPLCPNCGDNKLFSKIKDQLKPDAPMPDDDLLMTGPMWCVGCGWKTN